MTMSHGGSSGFSSAAYRAPPRAAALLLPLVMVAAGCLGSVPSSGSPDDAGRSLWSVPSTFEAVGSSDPVVTVSTFGNRTVYTFNGADASFQDGVVRYAIRAREPIQVGTVARADRVVDRRPPDGWIYSYAYIEDAPIRSMWADNSANQSLTDHGDDRFRSTLFVPESRHQVEVRADGDTVVSEGLDQPRVRPFHWKGGSGSLDPNANLSTDEWVLVRFAGASPKLGDGTYVETRVAVTGAVDVYRLPDGDFHWGFGFDDAEDPSLSATAGTFQLTQDVEIRQETTPSSFLEIDTRGGGEGNGTIIFGNETVPIPQDDWLQMSSTEPGEVGFDVQDWGGKPAWILTDAWWPTRDRAR